MKKVLFVLTLAAILLASCSKEGNTIKIGVGGAHSGDLASYGIPTINAAQLVVDKWNEDGGLLGKQIELITEDDQCKPEIATNTAAKLVGEKVVAVIGHICSGATKAALGIYKDSQILTISPSATNPPLTQSGDYPNFFRTIAPDDAQAVTEVDFAVDVLGLQSVAILHDKGDYGKGFAEFCQSYAAERNLEVVLFEGVTPGGLDYSAILNKVKNSGAEALIWGGYHPEASKLVTQMSSLGIVLPFLSDDGVKDNTFIDVAGAFSEGVYATGPVDTSSNSIYQEATAAHVAKYGEEPGAFFYNAYAATEALLSAIETAGTVDYAAVRAALQGQYVETPLGNISFDSKGDAIGVGFSVYQVQNGEFVEIN
ncbi:MAG: branched-chain amino acid ABC transporter substrate-binding protein [Spirochaetaceae bacterium]|jgi:branched-chain amino acid transport system substrate-binding protein|nr:branched-chain amino acid ABC transporter substrate-binding protein [Spirochaetaceae bacterium]